jgi:hypothetical protein
MLAACACAAPAPPGSSSTAAPAASARPAAADGGAVQLNDDACRAMTTSDVQAALGVQVTQLPVNAPPPGGGPGGTMVSGCNYTSASGTVAGASLFLFKDMPIDFFGGLPGYEKLNGVGDRAYLQGSMVLGQKGHTTFQLILLSDADQPTKERKLEALARAVAGRL